MNSNGYDGRNFRSYYSLGGMALERDNRVAAKIFFEDAVQKVKSPYGYANISDLFLKDDKYFEAIFALQEGIGNAPESGELYNNLALLYNKTDIETVFISILI